MKCERCDAEAVIFLTQLVKGKMTKLDLCEKCAKEMGVTSTKGVSIANLMADEQFLKKEGEQFSKKEGLICPQCGFTEENLRKMGRLGCSSCYQVMGEALEDLLASNQKAMKHVGKFPSKCKDAEIVIKRKELKDALGQAIRSENYEEAAMIRDQLQLMIDLD